MTCRLLPFFCARFPDGLGPAVYQLTLIGATAAALDLPLSGARIPCGWIGKDPAPTGRTATRFRSTLVAIT